MFIMIVFMQCAIDKIDKKKYILRKGWGGWREKERKGGRERVRETMCINEMLINLFLRVYMWLQVFLFS